MRSAVVFVAIFLFSVTVACGQFCSPEVKIFKIEHASAESLSAVASNLISQEGKISVDRNTNSLIVVDCPDALERIAQVIKALDVREKQVEIKVLVAETTGAVLKEIGLAAGQVIIPQGKYEAVIGLLKTAKDTNIRSEMTVKTLSNRPATIQVASDEVIGVEFVIVGSETAVATPVRKPIGNLLEVLPSVNNDGTINVVLRPSVSSMEEGHVPYERTILTQVVVNNGDTIAIGGAETQKQSVQKEETLFGIPFSKKTSAEKKRVVMFLTAKITD